MLLLFSLMSTTVFDKRIDVYYITPTLDSHVTRFHTINISMGFRCVDNDCGDMNATLDPKIIDNGGESSIVLESQKIERNYFTPALIFMLILGLMIVFVLVGGPSAKTSLSSEIV